MRRFRLACVVTVLALGGCTALGGGWDEDDLTLTAPAKKVVDGDPCADDAAQATASYLLEQRIGDGDTLPDEIVVTDIVVLKSKQRYDVKASGLWYEVRTEIDCDVAEVKPR